MCSAVGVQRRLDRGTSYKLVLRLAKLMGSLLFYAGAAANQTLRRLQGKELSGRLVVLCYHAVSRGERERFARQMDLLCKYAQPIGLHAETPVRTDQCYAAVTFDDAYCSVMENALPELRVRKIPCTIFVVSHQAGHLPWWAGTDGYGQEDRFLTEEQLLALPSDLVTIGSHSMTHVPLTAVSKEKARQEITGSRELLERTLARQVRLFAFPHGSFNQAVVDCCRQAGYYRTFSLEPTTRNRGFQYVIGRVMTDPRDWDLEFRLKIRGAYNWLPIAYRLKRKLQAALNISRNTRKQQNVYVQPL